MSKNHRTYYEMISIAAAVCVDGGNVNHARRSFKRLRDSRPHSLKGMIESTADGIRGYLSICRLVVKFTCQRADTVLTNEATKPE